MIQNKKHIIFDWNGTLVDDAFVFVDILNVLLAQNGLDAINKKTYRDLFCFPIKNFYKKIGLDVSEKAFLNLKNTFVTEYNKRRYTPKLFSNTKKTLQRLTTNNINLYLLSASHQNTLDDLVKYYCINNFFNKISGVDNYIADGKIINGHRMLENIGCMHEDVVLIGDTDHDLEVANSLKIDCILLSAGHQSKKRLQSISNNVIHALEDLFKI